MKIVILTSAINDLAAGVVFYENQRAGLGKDFFECLRSDIDSLKANAGIHSKVFGLHRLLSDRFPYATYYSVESDTVFVAAVLDCRRDPSGISKRIKGLSLAQY
jgi:hypothetical protein